MQGINLKRNNELEFFLLSTLRSCMHKIMKLTRNIITMSDDDDDDDDVDDEV